MSIVLLSLALSATVANVTPPQAEGTAQAEQTIVVTGTPLRDTERALRACLARTCPPNEDIDASLAHAENLFVAGKYEEARATSLASIGRNRRYAKAYPVDVSDLYRANSRLAAHLGEGRDYEWSVGAMHRILASAFPRTDGRVIEADFEQAEMYATFGRLQLARQVLEGAQKKAAEAGRDDLVSIARVRQAWLYHLGGDDWLARQALEKLAGDRAPTGRLARLGAMVVLARLDRKAGDIGSSGALIDEMRAMHLRQPVLLFAPQVDLHPRLSDNNKSELDIGPDGNTRISAPIGTATNLMATDNFEDRWIDVGFWVTSDGKVSDAEILRSRGPTDWTNELMRSIAGRVYSPIQEGTYRVERYSYTSRWMNVTNTRIRQRSPNARIEYVDLTASPPAGTR
ncbi:MAG: hypothetical protein QOH81_1960 [Sphingomonadales bacterium]|jgi:hypothetical protein|nr:hypothetical protein [Sphingomonadales bacterium]